MGKAKIRAVILANETPDDHYLWLKACDFYSERIECRVIDLTKNNWLTEVRSLPFDILLSRPGGITATFKQLYDERIYILGKVLQYQVFPSPEEVFIYENKRLFSFWLMANNIPHPKTDVFYNRLEALNFIENSNFPIVAKSAIGAAGSGVKILHNSNEAIDYLNQTFSGKGAPRRAGPNLAKGGLLKRGFHYVLNPGDISKKLALYKTISSNAQVGFVIFQEYIPHEFEWRVVRIGESFFAHKKIKKGEKASGTLLKGYETPPLGLFEFTKNLTDKFGFCSQAIDLFESERGYLVNEMQCIFGQSDPHQMYVDDIPGRYLFRKGNWVFEAGDFNQNQCYNLRVEWVLEQFKNIRG